MEVTERLVVTRALLERAQRAPEQERAWLLALAWAELQEGAAALAAALADAAPADDRRAGPARERSAPSHLVC